MNCSSAAVPQEIPGPALRDLSDKTGLTSSFFHMDSGGEMGSG
jgi:hypothetical protein